MKGLYMFLFGK